MQKFSILFVCFLLRLFCGAGQTLVDKCKNVSHVEDLDMERLAGHWFQYATSPQRGDAADVDCVELTELGFDAPRFWFVTRERTNGTTRVYERNYTSVNNEGFGVTDLAENWYLVDTDYINFAFEYKCINDTANGVSYENIELFTRDQEPTPAVVQSLRNSVEEQQISWLDIEIRNQSNCVN